MSCLCQTTLHRRSGLSRDVVCAEYAEIARMIEPSYQTVLELSRDLPNEGDPSRGVGRRDARGRAGAKSDLTLDLRQCPITLFPIVTHPSPFPLPFVLSPRVRLLLYYYFHY
jgi:hypothetical protein